MTPVLSLPVPEILAEQRLAHGSPSLFSNGACDGLPGAVEMPELATRFSASVPDHKTAGCPLPPFAETALKPSWAEATSQSRAACGSQNHAAGPVRNAGAPLVGIARLAALAPPATTKRTSRERPEYFMLPVKSILNRCNSKRVDFEWSVNPYRGCEFACKYCYARYTHEFMELDGLEFEKKIFVKENAAALLSRDLRENYRYAGERQGLGQERAEHIAIGTATDPYQPAEKEYGVTRACLEELLKRTGLSISITTKSDRVVRDIDLLQQLARKSALYINLTVTTMRPRLARFLEPRAPRPDLRIAAVRSLREAGIPAGVLASPLLPGLTDGDGELEAVAAAAREAGAQWFGSGVLFLRKSSARQFLPFIQEKFPRLGKQYEEWFVRSDGAPEEYQRRIKLRLQRIRKEYGFEMRPYERQEVGMRCSQMSLDWAKAPEAGVQAGAQGIELRGKDARP